MRPLVVFLLATLVPAVAYACPVCFDANEANRTAFIATTVFLSLLPLSMIGGVVLWIRSAVREQEQQ